MSRAAPTMKTEAVSPSPVFIVGAARLIRSEEHTSELQSQSNLVRRLLLEKKYKPASSISPHLQRRPYFRPPPYSQRCSTCLVRLRRPRIARVREPDTDGWRRHHASRATSY